MCAYLYVVVVVLIVCMYVQVEKSDDSSAGGVLLPDSAQDKPLIGTVVAVGKGWTEEEGKKVEASFGVGDTVMYPRYSGSEFEEDGDSFIVMRTEDILASLS